VGPFFLFLIVLAYKSLYQTDQRSQLLLSERDYDEGSDEHTEHSDTCSDGFERDDVINEGPIREDSLMLGGDLSGDEADVLGPFHSAQDESHPVPPFSYVYSRSPTSRSHIYSGQSPSSLETGRSSERTPLMTSRVSFSTLPTMQSNRALSSPIKTMESPYEAPRRVSQSSGKLPVRKSSQGRSINNVYASGSSTFSQTVSIPTFLRDSSYCPYSFSTQ
jgi:hypothetical protein